MCDLLTIDCCCPSLYFWICAGLSVCNRFCGKSSMIFPKSRQSGTLGRIYYTRISRSRLRACLYGFLITVGVSYVTLTLCKWALSLQLFYRTPDRDHSDHILGVKSKIHSNHSINYWIKNLWICIWNPLKRFLRRTIATVIPGLLFMITWWYFRLLFLFIYNNLSVGLIGCILSSYLSILPPFF